MQCHLLTGMLPVQAYFAKWGDSGEVDLSKAFAELIILTASRTLMGAALLTIHHVIRIPNTTCLCWVHHWSALGILVGAVPFLTRLQVP